MCAFPCPIIVDRADIDASAIDVWFLRLSRGSVGNMGTNLRNDSWSPPSNLAVCICSTDRGTMSGIAYSGVLYTTVVVVRSQLESCHCRLQRKGRRILYQSQCPPVPRRQQQPDSGDTTSLTAAAPLGSTKAQLSNVRMMTTHRPPPRRIELWPLWEPSGTSATRRPTSGLWCTSTSRSGRGLLVLSGPLVRKLFF